MTPLRVGLIGYGVAGAVFHAPLITATRGLELAAVVTSDRTRRAAARISYPRARIVSTADQLLADPRTRPDLVVIASPHRTHGPLARAALEHGVPVVVEKPFTATAGQASELCDLAAERGVPLTVFQNRRWDGDYLTVRALLAAGKLGSITRFESRFERWRPTVRPGWRESGDPAELGGVLYDLGSHLVDQALQLLGPATLVYAEADIRRPGGRASDDAFVALQHASGARSHLWMSAVAAQSGPRFRVLGDRAAYTCHGLDIQEADLRSGRRPNDGQQWGLTPRSTWGQLGTDEDYQAVPTQPGAYPVFYSGLERALRGDGPLPVDPADAVATADVLQAARESAGTGQAVTLGGLAAALATGTGGRAGGPAGRTGSCSQPLAASSRDA